MDLRLVYTVGAIFVFVCLCLRVLYARRWRGSENGNLAFTFGLAFFWPTTLLFGHALWAEEEDKRKMKIVHEVMES